MSLEEWVCKAMYNDNEIKNLESSLVFSVATPIVFLNDTVLFEQWLIFKTFMSLQAKLR